MMTIRKRGKLPKVQIQIASQINLKKFWTEILFNFEIRSFSKVKGIRFLKKKIRFP